jgi:hypothetical protein
MLPQTLTTLSLLTLRTSWEEGELDRIKERAPHSFQSGLLLLGQTYLSYRPRAMLKPVQGPFEPPKSSALDVQQPFIRLKKYIFSGRLWDVFAAEWVNGMSESTQLACKVVCPYGTRTTHTMSLASVEETRRGIRQEHAIYSDALKGLQGTSVGVWYGLFGGLSGSAKYGPSSEGIETWIAVTELGGRDVPVEYLSAEQK